jgi:hypothetical protein
MGGCATNSVDAGGPSRPTILRRSSPGSRSLVRSGADGSTRSHGAPRGTLRALVPRGLCGDGVPGDGPGGLKPKRVSSREDWSISTALCLRRIGRLPHDHFPRWEAIVLGVGIDWAEEFHVVALGRPDEGVIEIAGVQHSPAAVAALVTKIARLEPDPAEVRVVIETRHGLLVERLVEAGYVVVAVNPDVIARRRGRPERRTTRKTLASPATSPWTASRPQPADPTRRDRRGAARHRPRRRAGEPGRAAAAQPPARRPHRRVSGRAGRRRR